MTREELFAKALADRKAKKLADADRKNSGGFTYAETNWTALNGSDSGIDKVVRFVGNFPTTREEPTDAKTVSFSKIKSDSNKYFYCRWPSKEENPGWILHRVFDRVMEYEWDSVKEERNYLLRETSPRVFQRVNKNGDEHKFAQGWKPKQVLLANVIDRADIAWHKENKKTKLLSKSAFEIKESIGYEFGVPNYLYEVIFDDVVEYYGHWENYDVALRRSKDKPWYHAFHGEGDLIKISAASKDQIVKGNLTEEELSWERQDLDEISKITTYAKIKRNLGVFFQEVDKTFSSNFFDELCELAEKEKEEFKALKEKETPEAAPESKPSEPIPEATKPKEEPPAPPVARRAAPAEKSEADELGEIIDFDGLTSGTYNGTKYLGIEKLRDSEKKMIHAVNDDGSFTYLVNGKLLRTTADGLLPEEKSKFLSPDCFAVCPKTGLTFV